MYTPQVGNAKRLGITGVVNRGIYLKYSSFLITVNWDIVHFDMGKSYSATMCVNVHCYWRLTMMFSMFR